MIEPLTVLVSVVISVLIVRLFAPSRKKEILSIQKLAVKNEILGGRYYRLNEKIDNVRHNAAQTDEIISKGVDALATHLKLEIIPYKKQATESQILFDVVKLKKHKK